MEFVNTIKNVLPLQVLDIQYLHECIGFELKIGDEIYDFVALCRSPCQTQKFSGNLVVAIGDFNAKSKKLVLENITLQFGLQQIIKEPTHILDNSSSCIDLNQSNLITESDVYWSLHPNCHHQVVYAKFNFRIYVPLQYHMRGLALQRCKY